VDEETTVMRVRAPAATEAEVVLEVDVQEVTVEAVIGIPAEEVVVAESFESRERLVAAEPVAEISVAVELVAESPPDVLAAVEEADDDEDAEPLSSRRPVAPQTEERLADLAFGAEEPRPPRHTPPPESGRLPAAPEAEFETDVTGVREATPIAVATPPARAELIPESTTATLVASDAVIEVVAAAQRFSPATFNALLDASLAL
jgi:hypothetical protein